MSFINCTIIDKETVICDNETYKATDLLTYEDKEFWIYLGIYVGLVLYFRSPFFVFTLTGSFNGQTTRKGRKICVVHLITKAIVWYKKRK
jgi:hypothetical protein